ncbi:MAG: Ig-like domain-containing protein [Motiliproteus sp.]
MDSNGLVTIVGVGSATITATEAVSANYLGQSAQMMVTVAKGAGVPLATAAAIAKTYGDANFTPALSGGNGGAISYSSDNPSVATVDSNGLVTITGAGSVVITVTEALSANYLSQSVNTTVTVAKATGTPLATAAAIAKTYGDVAFTPALSGGNGGVLGYLSDNSSVATVDNNGLVTIVGAGSANITGTEAVSANYLGQSAQFAVTVAKAGGTPLATTAAIAKTYGDAAFTPALSGGNGGPISYSSDNSNVASVDSNGLVTIAGAGRAAITVTEAASVNFQGQSISVTVSVAKAAGSPLATAAAIAKTYGDTAFTPSLSGGNGGVLSYRSDNSGVASVDNNGLVTITGAGSASITVTEAASVNYLGQSAQMTVTVAKGAGTLLSAAAAISKSYGDAPFTPFSGGNGGVISYSSDNPSVASVDSNGLVTIAGVGSATITVIEAVSANFLGQSVSTTVTVAKGAGTPLSIETAISKNYGDAPFTPTVTGGNGGALSYSSDNSGVATVGSRGLVILQDDGSALITVIEAESGNFLGQIVNIALTVDKPPQIEHVFSSDYAFAALRADGSVVTWGAFVDDSRRVSGPLDGRNPVAHIVGTNTAFAALRADGSVVTWGASGGDISSVSSELDGSNPVVHIVSARGGAFAARRTDGSVVSWGLSYSGGDSSSYSSDLDGSNPVVDIVGNSFAFAALRTDGSVVSWGLSYSGGDSSSYSSELNGSNPVVRIFGNGHAFAALRVDGSVVTWGDSGYGGNSSGVSGQLDGSNPVVHIVSTGSAFAALRADGSLVAWGAGASGIASHSSELDGSNPVVQIASARTSLVVLRADGSVVTWGDSGYGGDSSSVSS